MLTYKVVTIESNLRGVRGPKEDDERVINDHAALLHSFSTTAGGITDVEVVFE